MTRTYEYASLAARVIATTIDGLIVLAVFVATIMLLSKIDLNNAYTIIATIFMCYIFYFTWPVSKYGYTPGYKLMGMKILKDDGTHLSLGRSFFRYIAKTILGVISFVTYGSEKRQCIHDKLVDSIVVKET